MSHPNNTILAEQLREWLEERSVKPEDIMRNDEGRAYILWTEDFSDSKGGEVKLQKIYLPEALAEIA